MMPTQESAQAILQTLADGIVTIDDKGIIESVNRAAEHLFRYSATEAVGKDVRDLMPGHDGPLAAGPSSGSKAPEYPGIVSFRRDLEGRRKDGSTFPIDLAVTEVELAGRRHFTSIVREITGRSSALEEAQWLAGIVNAADDAIISCDPQGIIVSWNNGAEALYGYTAQEAMGNAIEMITPQETAATSAHRVRIVLAGNKLGHLETQRLTKDGRKIDVSISGCRIADALGNVVGLAAVHRDISSQKMAEKIRRDLAVVEERNRLAREIHDTLAQSLTVMVLRLDLAGDTILSDPASAREDLNSAKLLAKKCVEEARRAVWDLAPQALDSSGLVEAVTIEMKRFRESGIEGELRVLGAEAIAMDRRNQSAALRIVQEALSNVLNHSRAKTVVVSLDFDLENLNITVADDGVGFEHRPAPGILSTGGGGFGLTSMQDRARLTGGSVQVLSAPGQGATMEARIPYRSRDASRI